ncbi:MAG: M28 family peptidase [Anaerolineales bacterium]|nr:M28 family peptidase [Anaerolineales bacterium]
MGYSPASITMEELPGGAGHNVYVTKVGSTYPNVYIEFSAHMDTVTSSPGGSDNASSSATVIELAVFSGLSQPLLAAVCLVGGGGI